MHTNTSSLLILLLLVSGSMLPPTAGQTFLHVFNHEPTGQAERGKTFYIFNVVQPTVADSIFSNGVPSVALRNQREFYIIEDVEASDDVRLDVQYFAPGNPSAQILGSLFTDINVIGKPYSTLLGMDQVHSITTLNASCVCVRILDFVYWYVRVHTYIQYIHTYICTELSY